MNLEKPREEAKGRQCEELMALGTSQGMLHRLSPRPRAREVILCSLHGRAGGDKVYGSYFPTSPIPEASSATLLNEHPGPWFSRAA